MKKWLHFTNMCDKWRKHLYIINSESLKTLRRTGPQKYAPVHYIVSPLLSSCNNSRASGRIFISFDMRGLQCNTLVSSSFDYSRTQSNRYTFFFLNNQPDALIISILFCYKTLHVSEIFSAHHQVFSTVHSALVSFMQVSDDRFQAESGWNCRKLLMMGTENTRNM
jgi:hypothetical protein